MKKKFHSTLFGSFLAVLCFLPSLTWSQKSAPRKFQLPTDLKEVSGLVVASPDSLWWHNDSGNSSELFLTNRSGTLIYRQPLPTIINRDWEDLTTDDKGHLYIGDFGDNRRQREDLLIYRYDLANGQLDSLSFGYPEGKHYDVEAMLWYQDSLHLFTKSHIRRDDLWTYQFVLPYATTTGAGESRNATVMPQRLTAQLRDSVALRKRVVTGAAIDPATGRVALIVYYYTRRLGFIPYSAANVYVIEDAPAGYLLRGQWRKKRISLLVATQYESVDFLSDDYLLVASEQTLFIKAKGKRVKVPRR